MGVKPVFAGDDPVPSVAEGLFLGFCAADVLFFKLFALVTDPAGSYAAFIAFVPYIACVGGG